MDDLILPSWYIPTREASDALLVINAMRRAGRIAALRIVGAPGVGKTAFAEALASANEGRLVILNGHRWVSVEETHATVDPAMVAGVVSGHATPDDAKVDGVLVQAAKYAKDGELVILLLDEWDKTLPPADALLYDFLQSSRVVLPGGEVLSFDPWQVVVIMTDNGFREMSEPLLRRCFRIEFGSLPTKKEADLLRRMTGVPMSACVYTVQLLNTIRTSGTSTPSLQEGASLLLTLKYLRDSGEKVTKETLAEILRGWLCKSPEDEEALRNIASVASRLFSEVCNTKRGGV